MTDLSEVILRNLIKNEKYSKQVLPYLQDEYFESTASKVIFNKLNYYINTYNTCPTFEELVLEISKDNSLSEGVVKEIDDIVDRLSNNKDTPDTQWLIDNTEKWVQDRALFNGVYKAIEIIEGNEKTLDKGSIPDILMKSLSISFDPSIGHDYVEDAVERFDRYADKEQKVETSIEMLNKATNGGVGLKTLNLWLAGPNVGKTLVMCSEAAYNLRKGKNVLYITLEISEIEISKRIDANLLDIPIEDIVQTPKAHLLSRMNNLKKKTLGKLKIKEFPQGHAHAGHFKILIDELWLKQKFKPDIVFIDYLGICASSRLKNNSNVNSFTMLKSISEEIRALAQQLNIPIWSAIQFNRGGASSSDPGMEDISESFGIAFTADFIAALISPEELANRGQILVKQVKSRYGDKGRYPKWLIGVDKPKMRIYDLDDPFSGLQQDSPVMSNTDFGKRQEESEIISKIDKFKNSTTHDKLNIVNKNKKKNVNFTF